MAPRRNKLLRAHTNDIHAWLTQLGADPRQFEWRDDNLHSPPLDELVHVPSGFFMRFYGNAPDEWGEPEIRVWLYPGLDTPREKTSVAAWSSVKPLVQRWYAALRSETEVPDLWETALGQAGMLGTGNPANNEPFTAVEQKQIAAGVDAARERLRASNLHEQTLADVNGKLDYLVDASTRMGRFDWRNVAVSVVLDIAVASAFDPNRARELFNIIVGVASKLLGA